MKRVFAGVVLAIIVLTLWAVSADKRVDVTKIRTIDGELVTMLMLEKHSQYLYESDYESPEQVFDSWFRPGEFIEEKSVIPQPDELLLYHHVFGQPAKVTKYYTYLVANAAIGNTHFYFDAHEDMTAQTVQNRAIVRSILEKADRGDADARWVIDEIEQLRNVDVAGWVKL